MGRGLHMIIYYWNHLVFWMTFHPLILTHQILPHVRLIILLSPLQTALIVFKKNFLIAVKQCSSKCSNQCFMLHLVINSIVL